MYIGGTVANWVALKVLVLVWVLSMWVFCGRFGFLSKKKKALDVASGRCIYIMSICIMSCFEILGGQFKRN